MNVVIIGGGLAGLYTAYLCSHHYPDAHIHLCEAHNRLGGRIYTVRKEGFQFEGGAGRIGPQYAQPILWKLVDVLNRTRIGDEPLLQLQPLQPLQDVRDIVRAIQLPPGPERSAHQVQFGYDAEFELMSPQVAGPYIERHFYGPFFSMEGGLDKLTLRLEQEVRKKPNVSIHLQKRIRKITRTHTDDLFYDKLFVCVEDPSKIQFESVQVPPELTFTQPVELMRVFVQVQGFVSNEKRTGPGPVRMWIPMDPERGLYQIYTDSHWAREWNKIQKLEEENVRNTIVQNTVRMFLNQMDVSVRVVDFEFWKTGVHVWTRPVEKLSQTPGGPVWFAGEVASVHAFGWMEGALDSVRAYFD